jgi:hypothetical protein
MEARRQDGEGGDGEDSGGGRLRGASFTPGSDLVTGLERDPAPDFFAGRRACRPRLPDIDLPSF